MGAAATAALAAVLVTSVAPVAAQTLAPAARGTEIFASNCFACHGAQGQGVPGLAPALAGPLSPVLARPEGRGYVLRVLLHGLSGRIVSQGQTFVGAMPSQAALSDADLVALGTHLAGLNGQTGAPFDAAEVAAARAESPAPSHKALRELRARVMP